MYDIVCCVSSLSLLLVVTVIFVDSEIRNFKSHSKWYLIQVSDEISNDIFNNISGNISNGILYDISKDILNISNDNRVTFQMKFLTTLQGTFQRTF